MNEIGQNGREQRLQLERGKDSDKLLDNIARLGAGHKSKGARGAGEEGGEDEAAQLWIGGVQD